MDMYAPGKMQTERIPIRLRIRLRKFDFGQVGDGDKIVASCECAMGLSRSRG